MLFRSIKLVGFLFFQLSLGIKAKTYKMYRCHKFTKKRDATRFRKLIALRNSIAEDILFYAGWLLQNLERNINLDSNQHL